MVSALLRSTITGKVVRVRRFDCGRDCEHEAERDMEDEADQALLSGLDRQIVHDTRPVKFDIVSEDSRGWISTGARLQQGGIRGSAFL